RTDLVTRARPSGRRLILHVTGGIIMRFLRRALGGLILSLGLATTAWAQAPFITVASTTSTEQSGLFAHILPKFKEATGIEVRVVAVGTGQAFAIARRGDADILLVHDTAGEEKFIAEGYGIARTDVMYNDFVLIGPKSDPAKRSEEHTSELQSRENLVCRLLLEKKNKE